MLNFRTLDEVIPLFDEGLSRLVLRMGLPSENQLHWMLRIAKQANQALRIVQQKISGTFRNPVEENPSFVQALAGPVRQLLKSGRALFPGGKCEVFYAGSVPPPKA